MSKIELQLPAWVNARVVGALYTPDDLEHLGQDMLQIELPGDKYIDVGWYPDHRLTGKYMIIAFQGVSENPLCAPMRTRSWMKVRTAIQRLVLQFGNPETILVPVPPFSDQFTLGSKAGNMGLPHNSPSRSPLYC